MSSSIPNGGYTNITRADLMDRLDDAQTRRASACTALREIGEQIGEIKAGGPEAVAAAIASIREIQAAALSSHAALNVVTTANPTREGDVFRFAGQGCEKQIQHAQDMFDRKVTRPATALIEQLEAGLESSEPVTSVAAYADLTDTYNTELGALFKRGQDLAGKIASGQLPRATIAAVKSDVAGHLGLSKAENALAEVKAFEVNSKVLTKVQRREAQARFAQLDGAFKAWKSETIPAIEEKLDGAMIAAIKKEAKVSYGEIVSALNVPGQDLKLTPGMTTADQGRAYLAVAGAKDEAAEGAKAPLMAMASQLSELETLGADTTELAAMHLAATNVVASLMVESDGAKAAGHGLIAQARANRSWAAAVLNPFTAK